MRLAVTAPPLRFSEDADGRFVARDGDFELVIERQAPGWVWGCLFIWGVYRGRPAIFDWCGMGMGSLEQIEERFRQALRHGGFPGRWDEAWRNEALAGRPWTGHRLSPLRAI